MNKPGLNGLMKEPGMNGLMNEPGNELMEDWTWKNLINAWMN